MQSTPQQSSQQTAAQHPMSDRQLQRRVFLKTMQNVYPNSIRIQYIKPEQSESWLLSPQSLQPPYPSIPEKHWQSYMHKLHQILMQHHEKREMILLKVWAGLFLIWSGYAIAIGWALQQGIHVWFQAVTPVLFVLSILIIPNLFYSKIILKPFLNQFDQWRREVIIEFERNGYEIMKLTTGELLANILETAPTTSSENLFWFKLKLYLKLFYYGSNSLFYFSLVQVDIFWRKVKSGKRVRRYSLITTTATMEEKETIRDEPNLKTVPEMVEEEEEGEEIGDSHSTLGAQ